MKKFKKPILFALAIAPIAFVATVFTALYQLNLYSEDILSTLIAQFGSKTAVLLVAALQGTVMIMVVSFLGYILSRKVGLWTPLRLEKEKVWRTLAFSVAGGLLFSLDYWTFGSVEPIIRDAIVEGNSLTGVLAAVLYGGIIEEILLRLFVMSLLIWGIWKIIYRKKEKEDLPRGVFVWANIITALLFAAGHLPMTINLFPELTPMILFRCFLFNGGLGLLFGWLYRKYGIWYAMISHATVHIVSKLIWMLFL